MRSTMQQQQLGVPLLLRHAHRVVGRTPIVTQSATGRKRSRFSELAQRAGRLGSALEKMGFGRDTVVGTFCAATQEHLEAYLGIPASGKILHTVNIRLHDDQLDHVIRDGADEVLIVDAQYVERMAGIAAKIDRIKLLIIVGDSVTALPSGCGYDAVGYEDLLRQGDPQIDWPEVNENDAAVLCYTGGTTGDPKGVAYSHRSLWLQAMALCTANALGISASSRVLPAVPLYHVNGWGLPFAAIMAGAGLILPGYSLQARAILQLIDEEQPTIAAGVPTIWSDVLERLQSQQRTDLASIQVIACGGSQVPQSLADAYEHLGVRMTQAWGMTETLSMSAFAQSPPWATTAEARRYYGATQGRVVCGLEVRSVDSEGQLVPNGSEALGEIQIRGPWVAGSYINQPDGDGFHDGWLRTGDMGSIDQDGYIVLSDRAKDAVKSGGEWISSMKLEEAIRSHPAIEDVAVVAVPDPRWQERPGALLVLRPGQTVDPSELAEWLRPLVASWWLPSFWAVCDALPRTSVGKIDKKLIRQRIKEGSIENI